MNTITAESHTGSRARYVNSKCRCDNCKQANADYMRAKREEWAQTPFDQIPHGTCNGYVNYNCHCEECTLARTVAQQERKAARK